MRIFHVLKHAHRGNGNVHVAVDLACEQARKGHDVHFLAIRGPYTDLLRRCGVTVAELPAGGRLRDRVATLLKLARATRQARPEVLHAHMMSAAVMGRIIAWAVPGLRLITTVHNSFDKHSLLMRLGDQIVCVSEAERRLLLSRGFPADRLRVVLNGTAGSARDELPVDEIGALQQPSVVVVAGLHGRKGVDDVITAFARARESAPQWHLNIVGDGPDRGALEAQVRLAGLDDSVHFMGATLTPGPLLESAQIFATGSLADPCPLAVIEARRAGCAVIGTAVGGIPEILADGAAGMLVPPKDPVAMSSALAALMTDPAALAAWRERARDKDDRFTVERVSEEYVQGYETALRR